MFMQEALQGKLHHEATQPFGRCRCDARLDFTEGKGRDCFFIVCCGLCLFERGEPLLKQNGELLIHRASLLIGRGGEFPLLPYLMAICSVERRKLFVDPAKIEHSIEPPYRVISWNHFIKMECVEELPLNPLSADPSCPAPDIDRFSSPNHALRPPSNR